MEIEDDYAAGDSVEALYSDDLTWYSGVVQDGLGWGCLFDQSETGFSIEVNVSRGSLFIITIIVN